MVVLYEHSVKTVSLTLLKEDACNIEVVVIESNLQRSVTLLQERVGDTRKREWRKCTLNTTVLMVLMVLTIQQLNSMYLLVLVNDYVHMV